MYLFANAAGNASAAGTWDRVSNTPTLHASSSTSLNAPGRLTQTFTAPSLVDDATGIAFFVPARGTGGTVTATLQEAGVDVASSPAVNVTSLRTGAWVYFRLSAPYRFTTVAANQYRWKIALAGGVGTTSVALDSTLATVAFYSTDSRHSAPASGDLLRIISPDQGARMTVTFDAGLTFGNFTSTAMPVNRTLTNDLECYNNGEAKMTTGAYITVVQRGSANVDVEGYITLGEVATPIPAGGTSYYQVSQNGASFNHGIRCGPSGHFTWQGAPLTTWHDIFLTGGTGTTLDPAEFDIAHGFTVGDRVVVVPASDSATNYNETEERYVTAIPTPTTAVWSSTPGGADTALVYARPYDAEVLNITRTMCIKSDSTTYGWYFRNDCTTVGYVDMDWFWALYPAGNSSTIGGLMVTTTSGTAAGCDNGLVEKGLNYCITWWFSRLDQTHTGIIAYDNAPILNGGAIFVSNSAHNKTINDCYAVANDRTGFQVSGIYNVNMNRCKGYANNILNAAGHAAFRTVSFQYGVWSDLEAHCNRGQGFGFNGSAYHDIIDPICGTRGSNTVDFYCDVDTFSRAYIENPTTASPTMISGYTGLIEGSKVAFQDINGNTDDHAFYSTNGEFRSTGVGLTDTTYRTADHLSARMAPNNTSPGKYWDFLVLAKANSAVSCFGFIKKNTLFGADDVIADLYLPGLTPGVDTPDDTYTLPAGTGYNPFFLGANHAGAKPRMATVRISAKSSTAGAYAYLADFFNGSNDLINFNLWYRGEPSVVMFPELGDPESVWAVLESTQTSPGTMGKKHVDNLTFIDFMGLNK